jgi:fibronectin type 3 domain-containing protein
MNKYKKVSLFMIVSFLTTMSNGILLSPKVVAKADGNATVLQTNTSQNNNVTTGAAISVPMSQSSNLPQGMIGKDIGNPGKAGLAVFNSATKQFIITGSGKDIDKTATGNDQFQFSYIKAKGDFTISARILGLDGQNGAAPGGDAKVGLMVRSDVDNPNSYHVSQVWHKKAGARGISRYDGFANGSSTTLNITLPINIKMQKTGDSYNITFEDSSSPSNIVTKVVNAKGLSLDSSGNPKDVYVGMAVTSADNTKTVSATFDNVKVIMNDGTVLFNSNAGKPVAPTNLQAIAGNSLVGLTWDPVVTASSYTVKQSTNINGPFENVITTNKLVEGKITTSIDGLKNNVTYYYKVTATNDEGEGQETEVVSVTPLETLKPLIPDNVVVNPGNSTASLKWDAVKGASSYKIFYGTDENNLTQVIDNVKETNKVIDSLKNSTKYYFAVCAVNSNGESDKSKIVSVTPLLPAAVPTGFNALGADSKVNLVWDKVEGSDLYVIKRALKSDGIYKDIATTKTCSYVDKNVVNGTEYLYKITSSIGNVQSEETNSISVVPQAITDSIISNLKVEDSVNQDSWSVQKNFNKGSQLFGDSTSKANLVPDKYLGCDFIRSSVNSKIFSTADIPKTKLASFTLNDSADVYVALDNRVYLKPTWLSEEDGWIKTADTITDNKEYPVTYDIYRKNYDKGSNVELGPNTDVGQITCENYFVIVKKQSYQADQKSKIVFKDLNGNVVTKLKASTDLIVNANVANNAYTSKDATLVVGLYDSNNKLIKFIYTSESIKFEDENLFTTSFKLPDDINGLKVKAFIWDNFSNMKLISDIGTLN